MTETEIYKSVCRAFKRRLNKQGMRVVYRGQPALEGAVLKRDDLPDIPGAVWVVWDGEPEPCCIDAASLQYAETRRRVALKLAE